MTEAELLQNKEMVSIFNRAVLEKTPAILTHMSKNKWHMSKVIISDVGSETVHVELAPKQRPLPINININQPIGLTFKLEHNKYMCESVICGLEPSAKPNCGGRLVVEKPVTLDKIQKRSYHRAQVPKETEVNILFWHRGYSDNQQSVPLEESWEGKLVDLSAGGLQIGLEESKSSNFKRGQIIGMKFTPLCHQKPLIIEGQIRHMAKTASNEHVCLGVQIVGLEATEHGREKLKQLASVVDEYHELNKQNEDA